jgi:sulfoxide reductase heme-binding subunit YedZ
LILGTITGPPRAGNVRSRDNKLNVIASARQAGYKMRERRFRMYPWLGYDGRVSGLKLTVFVLLFVPGLWTAYGLWAGLLGARPLNEAIHETGLWMIRFLFVALAISPLRQVANLPQLILVRRMIGVAAFCYGAAHILLYATDEMFALGKIASEIVLRIYLTIGFVALLGLAALAITSTDGMVRRLGRRWYWLHRAVYAIAILATIHFFMQSKADVTEPMMMAGILTWLYGYRLLAWASGRNGHVPVWQVLLLAVVAPALTAGGEAFYFWVKMNVDPERVLMANLTTVAGIRPAWVVLGMAVAVTAVATLRARFSRRPRKRARRVVLTKEATS